MNCEHTARVTDNVVTWCADCGEDWTAVTMASWPEGVGVLRFGAWGYQCPCGRPWLRAAGGVYCGRCDLGDTGSRVGVIFGSVVVLLLFAAIVVVSLTLAGWPR